MGTRVTYQTEVEDPVTGETLFFEAESEAALDQLIDQQFGVVAANQEAAHPAMPSADQEAHKSLRDRSSHLLLTDKRHAYRRHVGQADQAKQ